MSCEMVFISPRTFREGWFWDFTQETAPQIRPGGWWGWKGSALPGGRSS